MNIICLAKRSTSTYIHHALGFLKGVKFSSLWKATFQTELQNVKKATQPYKERKAVWRP